MVPRLKTSVIILLIIIIAGSGFLLFRSFITDSENMPREKSNEPRSTLTVIGPWAGPEMDSFLQVLERFEHSTGINVEYKAYRAQELATLLPAQFAAGKTPADIIFMWGWFIRERAKEDHILEVTDMIEESNYIEGTIDVVKIDNKMFGATYTGKVKPGFWYRKSFFEKHNLSEPKNWDEFVLLLETIKKIPGIKNPIVSGDEVGWPLSDVTEQFIITFGGPDIHKGLTDGRISWKAEDVWDIFDNRLVPLLEAGYFSEPIKWSPNALTAWWEEEYALYFMGSWITGMVDDPDDLGVFSLPECKAIVFVPDYFFIPKYSEHKDEAKILFKFLAGSEAQEFQVAQGGHIATNIHVNIDSYPDVDKKVAIITLDKIALSDLDDTIGGEFQSTFWDQLKLLWVDQSKLDDVLDALEEVSLYK
jgi:multiple sugar transport system substrate-binding protein